MTGTKVLRIGVVGLGLIGGSITKRLLKQVSEVNQIDVHGFARSEKTRELAAAEGVIAHTTLESLLAETLDYLFICTPIDALEGVFAALPKSETIIIDVASVKSYPLELATCHDMSRYVGTHPMFGTEFTGWEAAAADLGDGETWAVMTDNPDEALVQQVADFVKYHLDGVPVLTTAKEHDEAIALSSHLPHVLAYELSGLISDGNNGLAEQLSAGSFRSASRVAQSNTEMFAGMLEQNPLPNAALIRKFADDLNALADSLESGQAHRVSKDVHHFIARSDKFRERVTGEHAKPTHVHKADGWVKCTCGREHWGKSGAAGLFMVRTDAAGEISELLLQHRAFWSAGGGTWGTLGGALDEGESAVEGALREANEEGGVDPNKVEVLGEVVRDHQVWKYTTVICREKPGETVTGEARDQESLAVEWKPLAEVQGELPLLSAFGRELPELLDVAAGLL
jgi:prephenate dehydrogenase/8-oxo-dGTP pyrophosphatase MutT (NUDIX family)